MIRFFRSSILMLAITIGISGCDDKENQPAIEALDQDALAQTVFADQTDGKSGVTFVTSGPWTSTITEGTLKSVKAGTDPWVSINPDHGDAAGTYSIVIELLPNATGEDRTANIIITCNGTDITIAVTQKATKEDGEPYEGITVVPFDGKITAQVVNGSRYNNSFSTVKACVWYDEAIYVEGMGYFGSQHIATGVYANGGFTMTLPATPDNKYLKKWVELSENEGGGGSFSDNNVKVVIIDFFDAYNAAGKPVDYFFIGNLNEGDEIYTTYMYVDRDVTVTDSEMGTMSLKKGWNILYYGNVTQKAIDGTKWYTMSYLEETQGW